MDFLAFLEESPADADFVADVPEGEQVPEVVHVEMDREVTVLLDDPKSAERKEEILQAHEDQLKKKKNKAGGGEATSSRPKQSKRKGIETSVATSKKPKVLKGIRLREPSGGAYKLQDEGEEDPSGAGLMPGRGKGAQALHALQERSGHAPGADKEILDVEDSEDAASVTGGYYVPTPTHSSGPPSMRIPLVPEGSGPFSVSFPNIPLASDLGTEEERMEYVEGVMVPSRLHDMAMKTHGSFRDYANETAIRSMCVQAEYCRRWKVAEAEKARFNRHNNELRRKVKKLEDSVNPELVNAQLEDLRTQKMMETQKTEMVEQELERLRVRFNGLEVEKEEWVGRSKVAEEKAEAFVLDLSKLTDKNREMEEKLQALEQDLAAAKLEKKQIIEALPSVVRKLHLSCEFAKEMAKVQNCVVAFGGHRSLERLRGRNLGLDVATLPGYNPQAMPQLKAAAVGFQQAEYDFLLRLASSSDLPAEEWLRIEPSPFPDKPPTANAPVSSAAPSSSVVHAP